MGHVRSTEKALKVLKNSSGLKLEIEYSKKFHQEGIPILVSHQVLRDRDLGQIDLARMRKKPNGWILEIGEVKSSRMGEENMERFQLRRLFSSQNFLSGLFGYPVRLIHFVGSSRVKRSDKSLSFCK